MRKEFQERIESLSSPGRAFFKTGIVVCMYQEYADGQDELEGLLKLPDVRAFLAPLAFSDQLYALLQNYEYQTMDCGIEKQDKAWDAFLTFLEDHPELPSPLDEADNRRTFALVTLLPLIKVESGGDRGLEAYRRKIREDLFQRLAPMQRYALKRHFPNLF